MTANVYSLVEKRHKVVVQHCVGISAPSLYKLHIILLILTLNTLNTYN